MTRTDHQSSERPAAPACLLCGGFAGGNTGDELNLAVALRDMRARFGDSVAIISHAPGFTRRQFGDIPVIPYAPVPLKTGAQRSWYRFATGFLDRPVWLYRLAQQRPPDNDAMDWLTAVRACKLLYLVGGGYLTDLFDLDLFLLPALAAQRAGVPIATGPLGIGPFRFGGAARKVAATLAGADLAVRDEESWQFCRRYGLAARRARDDGFRVREVVDLPAGAGPSPGRKPRIGVNIFVQHGTLDSSRARAWWIDLLRQLAQAPVSLEAFCFHTDVLLDYAEMVDCWSAAGLDPAAVRAPELDFRAGCRQLADFDLIISARFHAVVVGNVIGKPTFGVCSGAYYTPKMQAAVAGSPRSQLLEQSTVPAGAAAQRVFEALAAH